MSLHDDDVTNLSDNLHIDTVIQQRAGDPQRRQLLKSGLGVGALSFIGGSAGLLAGCGGGSEAAVGADPALRGGVPRSPNRRPAALAFSAVARSTADALVVASGYTAKVLIRLGDPIAADVPTYSNDGTDVASTYDRRSGDHHDAIAYFGVGPNGKYQKNNSERGLLVTNHEAITPAFLHPAGATISGTGAAARRTVASEVLKEFYVHGVSVVEVRRQGGSYGYVQDSPLNFRVHTLTEMIISGPAGGSPDMVTKFSPDGTRTRGTVNDCANGVTPWGTYLACEENWAGYFRRVAAENAVGQTYSARQLASFARYGLNGNGRELWATVDPRDDLYARWNVALTGATAADDYRNAANTYGWNVEIDPFAAGAMPKKRTAMGRFAHEGAWAARAEAGQPIVFYMGCDSRNEYIYKYVSNQPWDPADAAKGLAAGDKYLDDGKLYVARFNADGTGAWLPLDLGVDAIAGYAGYDFADQADILINARIAADAVGATKMDRPEWGAVDPVTGDVYMTLTNSNATLRTLASTDAANPRHYNDPRSDGAAQRGNPNGHIIRWKEASPADVRFDWDIFLFGARAERDSNINVSALSAANDFSSPDGLWFSEATNICWIQTDDGAFTDQTNCMLLAALPGQVGDGGPKSITNTDAAGNLKQVQTFVGAPLGDARLKRFLVGPVQCEITGICETPDGKAIFVNVQHPGEDTAATDIGDPGKYSSHWPDGGQARPRSATIVITRDDGGLIGL